MSPKMQSILVRLTADKRKAALLCTCGVVALLLWGRLVFLREVPRTAYAEPETPQPAQVDQSETDPTSAKSASDQEARRVGLYQHLRGDPFSLDSAYFPEPADPTLAQEVTPKSPDGTTDDVADDQPRLRVPQEAKDQLSVLSVIGGREPVAMLQVKTGAGSETTLVHAGSTVAGFRVVSVDVTRRAVVVSKDGVNVSLTMLEDDGS